MGLIKGAIPPADRRDPRTTQAPVCSTPIGLPKLQLEAGGSFRRQASGRHVRHLEDEGAIVDQRLLDGTEAVLIGESLGNHNDATFEDFAHVPREAGADAGDVQLKFSDVGKYANGRVDRIGNSRNDWKGGSDRIPSGEEKCSRRAEDYPMQG
jgi:hypothetical protein